MYIESIGIIIQDNVPCRDSAMSVSDSDSGGWTVVGRSVEEEDKASSSASSDFVELNASSAAYHRKEEEDEDDDGDDEAAYWDPADWFWDDMCESGPAEDSSADVETLTRDRSESESIEELNLSDLTPDEATPSVPADELNLCLRRPKPGFMAKCLLRSRFESESEHSDFVRLENSSMGEEETTPPSPLSLSRVDVTGGAGCNSVPGSRPSSAASSISSSFRFVQPINPVIAQQDQRRHRDRRYYRPRHDEGYEEEDADDDADSIPSDVDDRCESDISGVAVDDSDLSSYGIGDIPLTAGDVRRSYRHQTNHSLNSILTTLAITALFSAIGIGFGHYLGIQRELHLRKQQELKLRDIQDDFVMCLKQRDNYHNKLNDPIFPDSKLQAITGVWKQKYEELIVEKVELEINMQELQQQLEEGTQVAKIQVEAQREEINDLQKELLGIKVEHSTSMVAAEEHSRKMDALLQHARVLDEQHVQELQQKVAAQEEELQTLRDGGAAGSITEMSVPETAEIQAKEEELGMKRAELMTREAELATREEELGAKGAELMTREAELSVRISESQVKEQELLGKTEVLELKKMELATLNGKVSEVQHRFDEVSTALMQRKAELAAIPPSEVSVVEIQTYELQIQELQRENHHLHTQLSSLLTHTVPQEDPLMEDSAVIEEEQFVDIPEDPAAESTDQMAVLQEQLQSTRNLLEASKQQAKMFEELHSQCQAELPVDFLSCMSMILPELPQGKHVNVTEFFDSLLKDAAFSDVHEKWAEFSEYLKKGHASKLPKQAKKMYKNCERKIHQKWQEFIKFAEQQKVAESLNFMENDKFQSVANKTKETVFQLSEKIHSTWRKVKNLSTDIFTGNEAINAVKDKVVDRVEVFGKKISTGWEKVKKNVRQGWFNRKGKKPDAQRFKDQPQDHYGNSPYAQMRPEQSKTEEFTEAAVPVQSFTNKADNKQTQSTTLEQKYEEFWKRANFDPDDYVAEDFFEENQREWKKEQKRFKKLHGRIHRLNEDMLYSMDDDDIEDMYEDLDDFEGDVDLEVQPEKLKAWLTCQNRWWKSRMQRKHRSEDFVKGCGDQLMRWQLRAMCKPLCKGKLCKRVKNNPDACQILYTAVIDPTPSCSGEDQPKDSSFFAAGAQGVQEVDTESVVNETYAVFEEFSMESPLFSHPKPTFGPKSPLIDDGMEKKEPNFVMFEPLESKEQNAEWLFERSLEREYHRQKPDWVFKRANSRNFEREKPWYYKRADNRRKQWLDREARGKK